MKAEWNDAPDYVRRRPRKRAVAWLIPGLIGTAIMLAALQMVSSAFLKGTVQGIADKRSHPRPAPMAEITRAEPAPTKDWDRVVEEVASQRTALQTLPKKTSTESSKALPKKQTIFTDANYVPRGADNVLGFYTPAEHTNSTSSTTEVIAKEVIVVGEKSSMKDRVCWPYKKGSVEQRNCRNKVGLNYRD